jgi:hypothetical protein
MATSIEVRFDRMARSASVEAAIHRWIARLEEVSGPIRRAAVAIERSGRHTAVCLKLELDGGAAMTWAASHHEIYVAVADAFREARRRLLDGRAPAAGRLGGLRYATT